MTFLLWLIETHIQELEEEIKLLKNHSIFVSNKSLYVFVFFITLIQMFVIDSFVEKMCVLWTSGPGDRERQDFAISRYSSVSVSLYSSHGRWKNCKFSRPPLFCNA